jgi:hypothetical protein
MEDFIGSIDPSRKIPDAGVNNVWYLDRGTDEVIVFVHGIFSDSRSCWACDPEPDHHRYWPELVARDERFKRFSIFLGGFYTALDAGSFGIEDCYARRCKTRPQCAA